MSNMRGGIMGSQPALDPRQAIHPRTRHGNTGFRIIGGTGQDFDNTTQNTFRAMIEIAAPSFDAVRPIFSTERTAGGYTVTRCNARAAANFTDPVGTPATVTLPGGGVVAASAGTFLKTFMVGDWLTLPSIPRDDGGQGAIVIFDAYVSTAGTIGLLGSTTSGTGYNNYATRSRHAHIWRRNAGDCVTTPANFVSTTNDPTSIIVGVEYLHRGRIVTVMGLGDSVVSGSAGLVGAGYPLLATERASDLSNIIFEYANVARGGATSAQFSTYLDSILSVGLNPDIMARPIGSSNDYSVNAISSAQVANSRRYLAANLKTCSENSIAQILWTMIPAGQASKTWGADDSLRRDYNDENLGLKGMNVLDFAAIMNGVMSVDGQMIPNLALVKDDEVHPNDDGNDDLSVPLTERLLNVA